MPGIQSIFFQDYIQRGIFSAKDIAAGSHCIAPRFLTGSDIPQHGQFGVNCIDVFYLHNPETQLGEISKVHFSAASRSLLLSGISGKNRQNTISTVWPPGMDSARTKALVTPCNAELEGVAKEIVRQPSLRFVQYRFNLGMTEALTLGNQSVDGKTMTIMEAAEELDITLIASADMLPRQFPHQCGCDSGRETDKLRRTAASSMELAFRIKSPVVLPRRRLRLSRKKMSADMLFTYIYCHISRLLQDEQIWSLTTAYIPINLHEWALHSVMRFGHSQIQNLPGTRASNHSISGIVDKSCRSDSFGNFLQFSQCMESRALCPGGIHFQVPHRRNCFCRFLPLIQIIRSFADAAEKLAPLNFTQLLFRMCR